jgi:hypothetical protein
MGTDYLYCENCESSHRSDYFLPCIICDDLLKLCDECYYDHNKIADFIEYPTNENRNVGLIMCDKCIEYCDLERIKDIDDLCKFNKSEEEIKNEILILRNTKFSIQSKINDIDCEIEDLKDKIKILKKRKKELSIKK